MFFFPVAFLALGFALTFFVMAGRVARPNTLVIQCPEQIATLSEREFMVELFKSIPKPVVRACQFLPKNYVRVTFKDEASRDQALVKGVSVRGFQLNVFEADPKAALVYCYWVPVEVSTDSIRHALSAYGQVLECQRQVHPDFQDIESGVRMVRVKLATQIPEVIRILNFPCKIYYRGQPKSCRSCKRTGHLARDCPFKDKCFRCGSADHHARNCTNAWNVAPPVPAAPGPHLPATSEAPAAAAPSGAHPPSASSCPPPPPLAPSGSHLAPGTSQGPASGVSLASSQVSLQDPLVAGLPLVPDSPLPVSSGMPSLEEPPDGPIAPSSAGALDQHGFLASLPSHPGVSAPNPPFPPSGSTFSSTVILSNNSVGGQCSPSNSNVVNSMGSTLTNVVSQKSSSYNGSDNSNISALNSSSVLGHDGLSLSYAGAVGQIPNSNSSNSHHPNSNLHTPGPPGSGPQNSAHDSVQNPVCLNSDSITGPISGGNSSLQVPGGQCPVGPTSVVMDSEVQIVGSNSVVPVELEMSEPAEDSSADHSDLSLEEIRALKKLLSPSNVKRLGIGPIPGDQGQKAKSKAKKKK